MTTPTYPTLPGDVRARLEDTLAAAADGRRRQLGDLAEPAGDSPAAAHRASVARILGDIEAAQRRLARGTFGACERCAAAIPVERLELRPWTRLCVACASR